MSCWLSTVLSYDPQGDQNCLAAETVVWDEYTRTSLSSSVVTNLRSLLFTLQFWRAGGKSWLPLIEIQEETSWQTDLLGTTCRIPKERCLSPCSSACASRTDNRYNSSTQDSCVSSKKALCKFHYCRQLCEIFIAHEIANKEICIWMARVSPVVSLQSPIEF